MTSVALYNLASQYRALAERLSDMDIDAQTVADTIEASGITDEIAVKVQGLEMVARCLEMHTPVIDAEIERLQKLKKQRLAKAHGLREYLMANMIAMGATKIEAPLFRLAIQAKPPSVDVYEPGLIPEQYMRTPEAPPPAPDKTAIAKAIKEGHEVPGARLVHGTRLAIS